MTRCARLAVLPLLVALVACGDRDGPRGPSAGSTGSSPGAPPPARAVPEVWTTFYPTTWLARRLVGDDALVRCPLPEEADPALWEPDTATLQGYQAADLIVVNGAGFERWVGRTSLPPSRLVDVSQGFAESFLRLDGAVTHSHGPGGAHVHEGIDGHTWFDPSNLKAQAEALHRALSRLLPGRAEALAARRAALAADLDALDAEFRALGPTPPGLALYASHPAWNYAARRYGWTVVNWHLDPGEMPAPADFEAIRARLGRQPAKVMLWEDTPLPEIATRLEQELGLASEVVPPCESESAEDRAAGRDLLVRMRENVAALRRALARR